MEKVNISTLSTPPGKIWKDVSSIGLTLLPSSFIKLITELVSVYKLRIQNAATILSQVFLRVSNIIRLNQTAKAGGIIQSF